MTELEVLEAARERVAHRWPEVNLGQLLGTGYRHMSAANWAITTAWQDVWLETNYETLERLRAMILRLGIASGSRPDNQPERTQADAMALLDAAIEQARREVAA